MREPISVSLRFRVLSRDRFTCRYCGAHPPYAKLVVDHAQSVADGGTTTEDNLVTACEPCNLGKGDRTVLAPTARDAMDADRQLRRAWTDHFAEYCHPLLWGELTHAYGGGAITRPLVDAVLSDVTDDFLAHHPVPRK